MRLLLFLSGFFFCAFVSLSPVSAQDLTYQLQSAQIVSATGKTVDDTCEHRLTSGTLSTTCSSNSYQFTATINYKISAEPCDPSTTRAPGQFKPGDMLVVTADASVSGKSSCCGVGNSLYFYISPSFGARFSDQGRITVDNSLLPLVEKRSAVLSLSATREGTFTHSKVMKIGLPAVREGIKLVVSGEGKTKLEYVLKPVDPEAVSCEFDEDATDLAQLREKTIALGSGLRRIIQTDLPDASELDPPSMKLCIEDGKAVFETTGGWARWVADNASFANSVLGLTQTAASLSALGLDNNFPNIAQFINPETSDLAAFSLDGDTVQPGVGLLLTALDKIQGSVLDSKNLTSHDPAEAFAEFQSMQQAFRQAADNATILRRDMMCRTARGIPQFYDSVHEIAKKETALLSRIDDADSCFETDEQRATARRKALLGARDLARVYRWHDESLWGDPKGNFAN